DGCRGKIGGLREQRGITSFDFSSKRSALAIGHRGNTRRLRATPLSQRGDLWNFVESAACEILGDDGNIVVAMRNSRQEAWRVVREQRFERLGYRLSKL